MQTCLKVAGRQLRNKNGNEQPARSPKDDKKRGWASPHRLAWHLVFAAGTDKRAAQAARWQPPARGGIKIPGTWPGLARFVVTFVLDRDFYSRDPSPASAGADSRLERYGWGPATTDPHVGAAKVLLPLIKGWSGNWSVRLAQVKSGAGGSRVPQKHKTHDAGRSCVGVQLTLLPGCRVCRRRVPPAFAARKLDVEPWLDMPSLVRGLQPNGRRDGID